MKPGLSIILPVLNEVGVLPETLRRLLPLRAAGHEVIVVDGGSGDGTAVAAEPFADRVLRSAPGRSRQMNAGAAVAERDVLLFLHADTYLPDRAEARIFEALDRAGREWGRFDVRLSGGHPLLRVVAAAMNLRSRLTGIATGDQAIFARRAFFESVGGFPPIPLMEDIAFSRLARRRSRPACLRQKVITSSRRWERHGILKTIGRMWWLRLAYACGAAPEWLASRYDAP